MSPFNKSHLTRPKADQVSRHRYYKRKERTLRCSLFFGGAALAGSFGGILAWGLGHINGGGLKPWGWLFAIEGMFTVLVGISAYFWVPGFPRQAKFLSEREHAILIARLQADGDSGDEEPFSWQGVCAYLSRSTKRIAPVVERHDASCSRV